MSSVHTCLYLSVILPSLFLPPHTLTHSFSSFFLFIFFLFQKKNTDEPQLSKKKLRRLSRMSVAQLKQVVERPDLVEMHDVSAHDPRLLIYLKVRPFFSILLIISGRVQSARNTVQVPRHWCFKRKYLQGKRGIEKPPFSLPEFIKVRIKLSYMCMYMYIMYGRYVICV